MRYIRTFSTIFFNPNRLVSVSGLILLLFALPSTGPAQNCIPGAGALYYIVRDAKGKVIDPAVLSSGADQIDTIELEDATQGGQPKQVKVIRHGSYHPHACGISANSIELKLTYKGKTMTLIFNKVKGYRKVTVDSIPFKEGRYEIDTRGERDGSGVVLAKGWTKVTEKAATQ